jgi:nucleoside-diphosphate-sugar epimerase
MRVVVTGATGNVGTSVLPALARDPAVEEIVGLARRRPAWAPPRTRWVQADVVTSPLEELFEGADVVIHLAWLIQPSRDPAALRSVNVEGSRRVFDAAARAGVGALVHASSVGVYSRGPNDRPVDESWPRDGIPTSFYSRHKAEAERLLDAYEERMRVVRLRPALIFKGEAAAEIRRYFIGPLLPSPLVHPRLLPVLPLPDELVVQAVHSYDVGEAYRLAATSPDARGAYNLAADPVLDPPTLAGLLGARHVAVPPRVLRSLADATWRLYLQPTPPGWVDMGLGVPTLDSRRAREELGWTPRHDAGEALLELIGGLRRSEGFPTPPLEPQAGGPFRQREFPPGAARGAT